MSSRHDHLDATAITIMIACCCCWGLHQVAIKVANSGISPLMQAGLRGSIASVLVLIWCAARGIRLFERDRSLWLGILLALVFAAEFVLLYWGLAYTTASRSIVLIYLAPFVVAIGAHLWVPGERLGLSQMAGLVAAFAGMLVAFSDALHLPSPGQLTGDAMIVAAAILWGASTVLIKATRLVAISPSKTLLYQLAGSALLLPVSLIVGEKGVTDPSFRVLAAFAYSTVGIGFVTYLAWFWLIANYPATKLSGFSFLAPLLGVIASSILLAEPITPALWAALALVAFGITLINRRPRAASAGVTAERKAA
jgi:drug/metabolite transporter (DMT)-like permease